MTASAIPLLRASFPSTSRCPAGPWPGVVIIHDTLGMTQEVRNQAGWRPLPPNGVPQLGSFGGRDRSLRGAAGRLDRALTAAGIEDDVKEYPDAGHMFLNDYQRLGVKGPLLLTVVAKQTPGIGYHEQSARDARRRIIAFFGAHLTT